MAASKGWNGTHYLYVSLFKMFMRFPFRNDPVHQTAAFDDRVRSSQK